MTHPAVRTVHQRSLQRVLLAGSRLTNASLPAGSRVLYQRGPTSAPAGVTELVARAVATPLEGAPLSQRLRPGMKVLVALSPNTGPFPDHSAPAPQAAALEVLLELFASMGVEDVHVVVATGLGSRLQLKELKRLVGRRNFSRLGSERLRSHNSEPSQGLHCLGPTRHGEPVELAPAVADADLLVSLAVLHCPSDGGPAQVVHGLGGQRSVNASLGVEAERGSLRPDGRRAHAPRACPVVWRQLAQVEERVEVFGVELTVGLTRFSGPLTLLNKCEDDLTASEQLKLRGLQALLNRLPDAARRVVLERNVEVAQVTSAFGGPLRPVHERALAQLGTERAIDVEYPSDALVMAVPYFASPEAPLDPLAVAEVALGRVFELNACCRLVRRGGTLVIVHPMTDYFEPQRYTARMAFVHEHLASSREVDELERRRPHATTQRPSHVEMYRLGRAVHPAEPFFSWYRGEAARQQLSKVIVVGSDNEYVPRLLGFETATTVPEALYRARLRKDAAQDVLCLHAPLSTMGRLP